MRVKDCMCKKVVRATSDTTLDKIAKLMQEPNQIKTTKYQLLSKKQLCFALVRTSFEHLF